jgi:hypothetical protein
MATYTLISSNILSANAASITFSAIPSTYTDLVLRISAKTDTAGVSDNLNIQYGGITSGYSYSTLRSDGSTATSSRGSSSTFSYIPNSMTGAGSTANAFGYTQIYIPSYTVAQYKPISSDGAAETNAATVQFNSVTANLMSNNATVSSIYMIMSGGSNFVTGSSFYLYGISNA